MNADKLLTQKEVSERLRISQRTIAKFRNEGKLSFSKFGHRTVRIRESELARFERSAVGGKSPAAVAKSGAAAGFSEDFSSPLPVKKEAQQ